MLVSTLTPHSLRAPLSATQVVQEPQPKVKDVESISLAHIIFFSQRLYFCGKKKQGQRSLGICG